jgi:hypothetical protein
MAAILLELIVLFAVIFFFLELHVISTNR